MIEQAETEWGKIHLHWLVKGAASARVFEIVIQAINGFDEVRDQIDSKIVGDAISDGKSPLFAALRSSADAFAAVADHCPQVAVILGKLELDRVAAAEPAGSMNRPLRL